MDSALMTDEVKLFMARRPVCDQHCKGGCSEYGPNRCDTRCVPFDKYRLERHSHRCVPRCLGTGRHCASCKKHHVCDYCEPNYRLIRMGEKYWRCVAVRRPPHLPLVSTQEPLQTGGPQDLATESTQTQAPQYLATESTQTQAPQSAVTCSIQAGSYSDWGGSLVCNPASYQLQRSYVVINGATVLTLFYCDDQNNGGVNPGVRLLTVDPSTCNVLTTKTYATGESAADAATLASDLTAAASGTLLIGVTADEPSAYISSAVSAMSSVCNVDISSLGDKGSFAFVCEVGYSSKTISDVKNTQAAPAASVTASVSGTGASMVIT